MNSQVTLWSLAVALASCTAAPIQGARLPASKQPVVAGCRASVEQASVERASVERASVEQASVERTSVGWATHPGLVEPPSVLIVEPVTLTLSKLSTVARAPAQLPGLLSKPMTIYGALRPAPK